MPFKQDIVQLFVFEKKVELYRSLIFLWLSVHPSVHPYIPNLCPAHNFVISSRILKLFYRNDHHIETTCRAQHLGRYLEGQGHSMTLQQNRVRPITSLFEVGF